VSAHKLSHLAHTAFTKPGSTGNSPVDQKRAERDVFRPVGFFVEDEPDGAGSTAKGAVVLLTNRRCPWKCIYCDLWKNTVSKTVPAGAIVRQIEYALEQLNLRLPIETSTSWIKLYNSGSFFDPRAIPPSDYRGIAGRVCGFRRVIVESHPALVGESTVRFRNLLAEAAAKMHPTSGPVLEVAMGLETANEDVLARLNKKMSLRDFAAAAAFLCNHNISIRAFVLVQPPYEKEGTAAVSWAVASAKFAFDCGARVVTLIPTRPGTSALKMLARQRKYAPPTLATLEAAMDGAMSLKRGLVMTDLWDLEQFAACPACFPDRRGRLERMNLGQSILPRVICNICDKRRCDNQ
jgi:radical SAM enzyme (TIGR01210 family)